MTTNQNVYFISFQASHNHENTNVLPLAVFQFTWKLAQKPTAYAWKREGEKQKGCGLPTAMRRQLCCCIWSFTFFS